MNYIKHLSGFFEKVSKDDRLNPTHVSLYVSLFQFWNACRFHNPISISRNEAMKVSKIQSKATYHKCIRELNDFGYLSYQPSYNPFKGSLVYLFNFQPAVNKVNKQTKIETSSELALNGYRTKNETSTEQALVPYINNINNTKQQTEVNGHSQKKSHEKNNESSKPDSPKNAGTRKKSSAAAKSDKLQPSKKESLSKPITSKAIETSRQKRPLHQEVRNHFLAKQWPEQEADKFYNHYQSNGWLVAGKTPMADWQASATKWMLNHKNFNANRLPSPSEKGGGMRLHTRPLSEAEGRFLSEVEGKNYNEPL